ncbi:MAG TPA: HPF/RaiA family ribosome-associated protein [Burkholderiales bacterium]|nr:HPF/RaiA family ribosome-associated protein [Betaproteobacteria bacterium]HQR53449.1 HPF/RaiA family ribosome-associated protein [Burkholderiales bacterium]
MRIEIQARRFALTEGLRQHVIRRIEYALRSFRIWVDRVEVQVGDVNGPRGGADKFCRVMVRLPQLPALVVRDLGADLYAVISSAAERTGRTLGRRMAHRIRTKRRLGMRRAQLQIA